MMQENKPLTSSEHVPENTSSYTNVCTCLQGSREGKDRITFSCHISQTKHETWSRLLFFRKAMRGRLYEEYLKMFFLWVQQGCQIFLGSYANKKESLINHSALFCRAQRRVITCGTHFEETKLVASITGRPVPESMSISWIFTPVGTISWGTMKLKQLFLDLIPLMMGGTTSRYIFLFAALPANHIDVYSIFTC